MRGISWLWICLLAAFAWETASGSEEKEESPATEEQPLRFWKDERGREIVGELLAYDGTRVTLRVEDNSKKVFPLSTFVPEDREFLSTWRRDHPCAPWIDPEAMPRWPQVVGGGPTEVKPMKADQTSGEYSWRSRHFDLRADVDLPLSVVRDLATIFEATRRVIHTLPLGLRASPPQSPMRSHMEERYPHLKFNPDLLRVQFYGDQNKYAQSGAPVGSGGFYHNMQNCTVLSLENLGIKGKQGLSRSAYMKSAFVLKHEISHHLLHEWSPFLPIWFREGFAEYLGAAPYSQGSYQFSSMHRHLHKYLNKWRFNEDPNRIPIMSARELMTTSHGEWMARLRRSTPILEYNSAAVLVHYFIHHDDKGDASHLAAYLDAIRRGISPRKAEKRHLLRGRSHDQIDSEIRDVWKKHRVSMERLGDIDPFQ